MALRHTTIPAGADQPGFGGVTPTLYGEEHTFSGGTHAALLIRNTVETYGSSWVASASGVLISAGANEIPAFSQTLPTATQDLITRLGTVTSGVWNATAIGALYGGTGINTSASTGVAQVAAGTWSVGTTLQSAVQDNITRTGTLVSGTTGAGFTVALSTSTITGTLADARLSANVPLLNAANTFTVTGQTIAPSTTTNSAAMVFTNGGGTGYVGLDTSTGSSFGAGNYGTILLGPAAAGVTLRASDASGGIHFKTGGSTETMTLSSAGILSVISAGTHLFGSTGGDSRLNVRSNTTYQIGAANSTGNAYYFGATSGTPDAVWSNNAGTEKLRLSDAGVLTATSLIETSAADGVRDNDYVLKATNLEATASRNFGLFIKAGSNASDYALFVRNVSNTDLFYVDGSGEARLSAGGLRVKGAFANHTASANGLDHSGSTARWWSWGGDASTPGAFAWNTRTSDGSSGSQLMGLSNAGILSMLGVTASNAIAFKPSGTQKGMIGMSGAIKGTAAVDLALFAEASGGVVFMINGSATDAMILTADNNLYINNSSSTPSAPSTGGYLYIASGELRYKGSSGTVTTIAPA